MEKVVLEMVGGVKVVAHDSLELITSYVLREQGDWFEDEIKFLRRLLTRGQFLVDIGANHGVYSLAMADAVGQEGHIWAFEPASSTADLFRGGISANNFNNITLIQCAISDHVGVAHLSLNMNSELNELIRDGAVSSESETVELVTLDDCIDAYGWSAIDFVKIDAEGEEANILKGGRVFFETFSPLIQYEVKAGNSVHMDLVSLFDDLGYHSYRLVPSLDLLVPFDRESIPDGFLLNLFCCKPDRACKLEQDGFLLQSVPSMTREFEAMVLSSHAWQSKMSAYPYVAMLRSKWSPEGRVVESDLSLALALHSFSRDESHQKWQRMIALERSFLLLSELKQNSSTSMRKSSFARVAYDFGFRAEGVAALSQLINYIFTTNRIDLQEPFLVPYARYESMLLGKSLENWVLSSILEAYEMTSSFSHFYTGRESKSRLEFLLGLGYCDVAIHRRLSLLSQRFKLSAPKAFVPALV